MDTLQNVHPGNVTVGIQSLVVCQRVMYVHAIAVNGVEQIAVFLAPNEKVRGYVTNPAIPM